MNVRNCRGMSIQGNSRYDFWEQLFLNCLIWMLVMGNDQERQENKWCLRNVVRVAKSVLRRQDDQWMGALKDWLRNKIESRKLRYLGHIRMKQHGRRKRGESRGPVAPPLFWPSCYKVQDTVDVLLDKTLKWPMYFYSRWFLGTQP